MAGQLIISYNPLVPESTIGLLLAAALLLAQASSGEGRECEVAVGTGEQRRGEGV